MMALQEAAIQVAEEKDPSTCKRLLTSPKRSAINMLSHNPFSTL